MTEGVGIGLDDNSGWSSVYLNLCAENEGQGIQNDTNFAIPRFGNVIVDNNRLARGARNITPQDTWMGEPRTQIRSRSRSAVADTAAWRRRLRSVRSVTIGVPALV